MIERHFLDDTLLQLRKLKTQAERAYAQIHDEAFFAVLTPDENSIAINHEARRRQHAVPLDRLPDNRRREVGSKIDTEFELEPQDTREQPVMRLDRVMDLWGRTVSLSKDGRTLVYLQTQGEGDIWLMTLDDN